MSKLQLMSQFLLDNFYDKKFSNNKLKYINQIVIATVITLLILLSLNVLPNDVVIASIGASLFMIFAVPHKNISRSKYVLGGYAVGCLVGVLCFALEHTDFVANSILLYNYEDELFGALAVGLTMFLMVVFQVEHPPAAAFSLGLVLHPWTWMTVIVTFFALTLALAYRQVCRHWMIDLI